MLMGSKTIWHIICLMFCLSQPYQSPFVQGMIMNMNNNGYDPVLLDDFVADYASNKVLRPRTGILYNISLPANFTGMEVSFVRVRARNFYLNGANFSSFHFPPRILPMPFMRRFYLIYQNFGNWSSYYYNVPNYTLITPVVGFMIYNAINSTTRRNATLSFYTENDPILVHFPRVSLPKDPNVTVESQCVRFFPNGSVEFSNTTMSNGCIAQGEGHFSIVIPSLPVPSSPSKKKDRLWKWWVIGFGVGIVGLVLATLMMVLMYKFAKRKKIKHMERQSERSEALDTTWVGRSKMPSATGIRTQPVIENDYVP
ncbi:unnamed protein product [Camellia sinensis]|uniref:Malectin-like domain-containing protein n=2 Tax=Camellia sinensis TaxID=4442 RepID=A0A4S4ET48_CAMSN|nr:hypothetical protein TEA_008563 [Camellia sinensis var. sinensis]